MSKGLKPINVCCVECNTTYELSPYPVKDNIRLREKRVCCRHIEVAQCKGCKNGRVYKLTDCDPIEPYCVLCIKRKSSFCYICDKKYMPYEGWTGAHCHSCNGYIAAFKKNEEHEDFHKTKEIEEKTTRICTEFDRNTVTHKTTESITYNYYPLITRFYNESTNDVDSKVMMYYGYGHSAILNVAHGSFANNISNMYYSTIRVIEKRE